MKIALVRKDGHAPVDAHAMEADAPTNQRITIARCEMVMAVIVHRALVKHN